MKVSENKFLEELEAIAREQKRLANTTILPRWALGAGEWLVVNPWRVLVPIATISYLTLRLVFGESTREIVLAIFGGFRL